MPDAISADALVDYLRQTLAARAGDAGEVLVYERAEPARAPALGVLRPHLPPALAQALIGRGVRQLYAHQVAAVEGLRAGQNVVLASPTASGKSLAFALPTLERLLLDPTRRALYLYPTKALIGDQLRALRELVGALPMDNRPRVASNRAALRHAVRNTSWVSSSAASRVPSSRKPSVYTGRPNRA